MNKYILLFSISLGLIACNNKEVQLDNALELYKQGLANSDAATTKVALNQLLLLDSSNTEYQDSLSRIYLSSGNFEAGIKYAEMVYNSGKSDIKLKENMAVAYQQVGDMEKAEKFIDNLIAETNDPRYFYQKLVHQFENRNFLMFDSISTNILDKIETDSVFAQATILMPGPVTGVKQNVPMKAATYFLIGNNALENRQDVNESIGYFQKSIMEFNEFEMPRYLLMEIEKMMMAQRR
jgi:tetratricopeptide (TPR) repeat protein